MSFREEILLSLKGCTIEYQGVKLYVIEEIEYQGKKYLYCINVEKAPDAEISFLTKEEGSTYSHVVDDKLFDELMINVGFKLAANELEKIQKEEIKE